MRKYLIPYLLLCSINLSAQIAIGLKWMGFTTHFKEYSYSKHYKGKLDKRGFLVVTDGLAVGVDVYINDHFFIKFAQSIIPHDCGRKFFGMTHLGLGYTHTAWNPHQASVSFGPMFFYRRNWNTLPYYSDPAGFFRISRNQKWQTKFVWHGGQIEYDYFVSPNSAISVNIVPAIPELFAFTPGWKMRFGQR